MTGEPTFRAFIAIEPPSPVRGAMHKLIRELAARDANDSVRWVAQDGIHLTVAFLGQLAEEAAPHLLGALSESLADCKPFNLRIAGTGAFPDGRRRQGARVIWAGVEGDTDHLSQLHESVRDALANARLSIGNSSFTPHITLGRVRRGRHFGLASEGLPGTSGSHEFLVIGVSLMESRLSRGPAVYVQRGIAAFHTADSDPAMGGNTRTTI